MGSGHQWMHLPTKGIPANLQAKRPPPITCEATSALNLIIDQLNIDALHTFDFHEH